MWRLVIIAIIALAAARPTISLASEEQGFRCPDPGTVMEFQGGGRIEFTSQDGLWCLGKEGAKPFRYWGAVSSTPLEPAAALWPLSVGKKLDYKFQGNASNQTGSGGVTPDFWYHDTITVLRKEPVQTKAGRFDAYVIELHREITGKVLGTFIRTIWWSPEVGYVVKSEYRVVQGIGKDSNVELKMIATPFPASKEATTQSPAVPMSAAPFGTSSVPKSSPAPSQPAADRLRALKDLLDQKLITPAEYDAKRKAILDQL